MTTQPISHYQEILHGDRSDPCSQKKAGGFCLNQEFHFSFFYQASMKLDTATLVESMVGQHSDLLGLIMGSQSKIIN